MTFEVNVATLLTPNVLLKEAGPFTVRLLRAVSGLLKLAVPVWVVIPMMMTLDVKVATLLTPRVLLRDTCPFTTRLLNAVILLQNVARFDI